MKFELRTVRSGGDVLDRYRTTPVGELFGFHSLGEPPRTYARPTLLVITCMDARVAIRLPATFAFVLRTAGANVDSIMFNIDYAVSVGGVRAIAVVGHDDCAMTRVGDQLRQFEQGLVGGQGWSRETAVAAFEKGVDRFAIEDPLLAAWSAAERLDRRYPGMLVAPLFYEVRGGLLAQIVTRSDP